MNTLALVGLLFTLGTILICMGYGHEGKVLFALALWAWYWDN